MQKLSLNSDLIYKFQSSVDLADSVLEDIKEKVHNDKIFWTDTGGSVLRTPDVAAPMPGGTQSGRYGYVLENNDRRVYYHSGLYDWAIDCINTAANELFRNLKFDICDAWVTRSLFGQGAGIHSHEWSMLSAIYYPHDCESSHGGQILFWPENPLKDKLMPFVSPAQFKEMAPLKIEPQQGNLLVFPSYLQHSITQIKKMRFSRYSVAMNAIPAGKVSTTDTGRLSIAVLR